MSPRRWRFPVALALAALAIPATACAGGMRQDHWWVAEFACGRFGLSESTSVAGRRPVTFTTVHFAHKRLRIYQPIEVVAGGGGIVATAAVASLASLVRLRRKRRGAES